MNLHRTESAADWTLQNGALNHWQKLAQRTHGIITPPNIITIIGFLLVLVGLLAIVRERYWLGLVLLIIGRSFDILDGLIAERTGTKSPLGEKLDAGFDKIGTVLTIVVLTATAVVSWRIALMLVIPQALITIISYVSFRHKTALHPSRSGKLSMAAAWLCVLAFVAVQELHDKSLDTGRSVAGALLVISFSLGIYAFLGYLDVYQAKRTK